MLHFLQRGTTRKGRVRGRGRGIPAVRAALNPKAVELMEQWYRKNLHHPYPSHQVIRYLAYTGDITVTQIKKWMANKRVRSCNTLSVNGSPHPNHMKKLQNNMSNIPLRTSPSQFITPTEITLPHQLSLPLQYLNWLAMNSNQHHQNKSMLTHHTVPTSYYGHAFHC